jgi:hypothetical protein
MFSVIIPTMWLVPKFTEVLSQLVEQNIIGEVIIINNNYNSTPNHPILSHPKIKMQDFPENIYVNPAYNYGVATSNFDKLTFMNDDIVFDMNIFNVVSVILDNAKIVAVNLPNVNEEGVVFVPPGQIVVDKYVPGMHLHHIGCLMFMNKEDYVPIPAGLNLYYGDTWLWEVMLTMYDQNYLISNFQFETQTSVTCNTLPDREWIYLRESHLVKKLWPFFVESLK